MFKKTSIKSALIAALAIALISPVAISSSANAADDIKIGVLSAFSGPLKPYGDAYLDGLQWGLNYYTNGKNSVNGRKLSLTIKDDTSTPAGATAIFKEMVANGNSMVVGTAFSTIGLTLAPLAQQNKILYISGPAKNDAITSAANKYVFRSGNTSLQDFAPLATLKPIKNKRVILFVEDNAFGAGNIYAAKAYLAAKGALFTEIKVPASATDITPFAKQAADVKADYIFIAWSNTGTSAAVFTALAQQKVYATARPITGLAGVASYDITGALFEGANAILTNSYFPGVVKNKAADQIAADFAKAGKMQDLFTSDGVNAALMILAALKSNPTLSTDKMISALESASFVGLKGLIKVNAANHTLTQSMFLVKLTKVNGKYVPSLVSTQYNTKV
jgi:branched-chain amino acid transport system substrate-binding protein